MIRDIRPYLLILGMFFQWGLSADLGTMNFSPMHRVMNANTKPSLVNSVDFHPKANLFCATFTHNNSVVIYQLDETGGVTIFQILEKGSSKLSCPQHALFSKEGSSLVVANWSNRTFNVYQADRSGHYRQTPNAVIPFPAPAASFRPHGMAFSPDGNYLAVAYGASKQHPRAVALYRVKDLEKRQVKFRLLDLLQGNEIEKGIPKGITFSPDGSCLLVTLSETNSVGVYTLNLFKNKIISTPRQMLNDISSQLSRPEDIKFTVDGNHFAVSNSDKDVITFYTYDRKKNCIPEPAPSQIMENPTAELSFPHGLAFSSDGKYLTVSQFGAVLFDEDSNLTSWAAERRDSVLIYKLK